MRKLILTAAALSLATSALATETPAPSCPTGDDYTLAIHGGAGVILKENMTDKKEARYRKSLNKKNPIVLARAVMDKSRHVMLQGEGAEKFAIAQTYADNNYCAVSATGTGEFFIRAGVARDICSRREYLGETIAQSANHVIHKTITDMKGDGGVIAIDEEGNYTFAFNTPGMYRGANKGGKTLIEIFDAK